MNDNKVSKQIEEAMKQLQNQKIEVPEENRLGLLQTSNEETTKTELDEYEQSAAMFHLLAKRFRQIGYRLAERKKKAPIRVLEALLFAPLEEVKVLGTEEEKLIDLCNQILYHKMKINEYALNKSMKQKENKSVEEK